jgi:hypothetical protein
MRKRDTEGYLRCSCSSRERISSSAVAAAVAGERSNKDDEFISLLFPEISCGYIILFSLN